MCRRCYVDDDTAGEIEKLIRQMDEKMRKAENIHLQAGDIHPSEVAPATWFYEWSKNKEKNIFYREGQPVLYMAGLYNRYQDEDRFVILTTAANESMKLIHDRMPLLLERDEIDKWLFEDVLTENFLQKTPALLERRTDFEQMSLFPVENSK